MFMLCLVFLNSAILLITISLRNALWAHTLGQSDIFQKRCLTSTQREKLSKYKCIGVKKSGKKTPFASVLSVVGTVQPQLLDLCWADDARRKQEGRKGGGNLWVHKDTGREARWGIQECEDLNVSGQPKERIKIYWIWESSIWICD